MTSQSDLDLAYSRVDTEYRLNFNSEQFEILQDSLSTSKTDFEIRQNIANYVRDALIQKDQSQFAKWFSFGHKQFTVFLYLFRGSKTNLNAHQKLFQLWASTICSDFFIMEITRSLKAADTFPGNYETLYNDYMLQIFQELVLYEQMISTPFESISTEELPRSLENVDYSAVNEKMKTSLKEIVLEMTSEKALQFKKNVYWASSIDLMTFSLLASNVTVSNITAELQYKYSEYEVFEYRKFLFKMWNLYSNAKPDSLYAGQVLDVKSENPEIKFTGPFYDDPSQVIKAWPKSDTIRIKANQYGFDAEKQNFFAKIKYPFRAFAVNFFQNMQEFETFEGESEETRIMKELSRTLLKIKSLERSILSHAKQSSNDIESVKAEREVLLVNLNDFQKQFEKLQKQVNSLQKSSAKKQIEIPLPSLNEEQITALKKDISTLKATKTQLEKDMALKVAQTDTLMEQLNNANIKFAESQSRISSFMKDIVSLKNEIADKESSNQDLQTQINEQRRFEGLYAQERKIVSDLQQLLSATKKEKIECDQNLEQLQNSAKTSENIDESLQQALDSKIAEANILQNNVDKITQDLKSANTRAMNAESQLSIITAQLEKQKDQSSNQILSLQSQIKSLEDQLADVIKTRDSTEDLLTNINRKVAGLQSQLDADRQALKDVQDKWTEAKAQLGQCQIALALNGTCAVDLQKATNELQQLSTALRKTQLDLQDSEKESTETENELMKRIKEIEKEYDNCQRERKDVETDANECINLLENKNSELNACESDLEKTQTDALKKFNDDELKRKELAQKEEETRLKLLGEIKTKELLAKSATDTIQKNEALFQQRLTQEKEQYDQLSKRFTALQQDLDLNKAADYPAALTKKDQELNELQNQLTSKNKEYDTLLQNESALKKDLDKTKSNLDNATLQMKQMESKHQNDLKQLEELHRVQTKNTQIEIEVDKLQNTIKQLETKISDYEDQKFKLESRLKEQEKSLEDFKICAATRSKLEDTIQKQAAETTDLYNQKNTLEVSLQKQIEAKQSLEALNQRYANDLAIRNSELVNVQNEYDELKKELNSKTSKIMTLEDQCKIRDIVASESLLHKNLEKQFEACALKLSQLENLNLTEINLYGQGGIWNIPRDAKKLAQQFLRKMNADQIVTSRAAHTQVMGSDFTFEQDLGNALFLFKDILVSSPWTFRLFSNDIYFPPALEKNTFVSKVEDIWVKQPLTASFWVKTRSILHENGLDSLIKTAESWIEGRRIEFLEHYKRHDYGNTPMDLQSEAINAWTLYRLIRDSKSTVLSLGIDSESFGRDMAYLLMDKANLLQLDFISNWDLMFNNEELCKILTTVLFGVGVHVKRTTPIHNPSAVKLSIMQMSMFVYPATARKLYLISKGFIPFYLAPIRSTFRK